MLRISKNLYRKIRMKWEIERRRNHLRNVLLLLVLSLSLSIIIFMTCLKGVKSSVRMNERERKKCEMERERESKKERERGRAKHKSIGKRFRLLCQRKRQRWNKKKFVSDNKSIIAKKAFKFERLLTHIKSFYISFCIA